jgi:hypothetical protein
MTTSDSGLSMAHDITPVIAKDVSHVFHLLWERHKVWICDSIPEIEGMSPNNRARILKERFEIKCVCSGIWATKDFITNDISTPLG